MDVNEVFIKRLQDLMQKSGRSQRQLAQLCNTTEASLSRYVNGERMPKPEILSNLATALGTTTDYLLGREERHEGYEEVLALVARSKENMTSQERKAISDILLGINDRLGI